MGFEAWLVLALVVGCVALFVSEWLSVDIVGILVMLALFASGVIDADTALAGFANPAVITVGALFIVSEGLVRTGAVGYLGTALAGAVHGNPGRILPLILALVLVGSAVVNNTPVVVLFVPIVLGLSKEFGVSPAKLLMPISFVSVLGGTCTLIGTSTNILINGFASQGGFEPLGMFEFLPLGLIFSAVGLTYLLLFSDRLLPDRAEGEQLSPDILKEYLTELRIADDSRLLGQPLGQTPLGTSPKIRVLQLIRGERIHWPPLEQLALETDDVVLIKGEAADVAALLKRDENPAERSHDEVRSQEWTLAEVVLTPDSRLIGRTLERATFRRYYGGATVLAIRRSGEHIRRQITGLRLKVGDVLLIEAAPRTIESLRSERDFLLLDGAGASVVDPGYRAPLSIAILAGFVITAAAGLAPVVMLAIAAATLMIASGCISSRRAYRSVSWDLLVLIAGMIALGKAMETSGLAAAGAEQLSLLAGGLPAGWRPYVVLSGFYLLVTALSNVVSNNAAAVLFIPLALGTAQTLGVDARPFLFATAYGASAAFALPIGYNTHLIVYGPGGYRLADYLRLGAPLNILLWIVASVTIPLIWPFHP